MATSMTNLFNFGRPLPEPFEKLPNKKVKGAASKYGSLEATLCAPVIKGVNAFCACVNGTGQGAVGNIEGQRYVAEYKSSMGADTYHLVVYDAFTGNFLASVYDRDTELMEQYTAHPSARDGAALFFAMMPKLLEDQEFKENFQAYREQRKDGFPDLPKAVTAAAILCDNAYRRVKDESCPVHVKVRVDKSGNLMRVSRAQLDSGLYKPGTVLAGEFTVFSNTSGNRVHRPVQVIEHKDFVGKYPLTPGRKLSAGEQALVPALPEWYVIPPEVVDICKHAKLTTGKPAQMRNFLLRGPAGTGKTMGAKAIAAGLGLPYMKYTCSAGTEIYDFVGMVFPDTEHATGDAQLDREQLRSLGGMTYENVSKLLHLPDLEDMDYDPAGVYQSLTGVENQAATAQDCMALVLEKVTEKVRQLSAAPAETSGQTYSYVETDFIKALKNGYVAEIQEPSTILQPGVLVGLNSLLEQEGTITLPTGAEDEYQVAQMVQVVCDMADFCQKNGVMDGVVGMRSLLDWVLSAQISGDPYTSALDTVVSKAAADPEDREALITSVLDPVFAPRRRKTA